MLDKCQNLVREQCCFRGEVTRLAVQGEGPAVFLRREAFAAGAAERVTFDPKVNVGRPLHAGTPTSLVERPRLLEPFPLAGEGDTYLVTFEVKAPRTAEVTLRFGSGGATSSLPFSGDLTDGTSCSGCTLSWPPGVDWHVGLGFATAGPHRLSESFPGFPEAADGGPEVAPPTADSTPVGAVVGATLDVLHGEMVCGQPGSEGAPLRPGETLSWSRTQLPEVDAVVWRDGALLVEISATSGPARATPAVPSTPVLPVPDSPVVPWSGGMLAAGIGGAALLIAAGLFVRRRRSVKKASGALAGAGRHGEAKPAEPESSTAVDIFYSYSMRDEELRGELTKHLSFLRQKGVLREWHEQKLSPGDSREAEIDRHLETAAVILLLVSSDYAASDTLWNRQMLRALERARRDGTVVIPVLLRPCTWEQAPFAHLQVLPRDRRPVTSWQDRDAALRDVAAGIHEAILRRAHGVPPDVKLAQDSAPGAEPAGSGLPEDSDSTPAE